MADSKMAQAAPKPNAAHKRLEVFIGKWKTEGQTIASTNARPVRVAGTDTYEWLDGGFFLIHRVDVRMGDEEVKAIEIIGYDASNQTYPMYSFDNQGNSVTMQASVDNGIWRFSGESMLTTLEVKDNGQRMTANWERSSDGLNWSPWMEVNLIRAS
jgi:hypothetical protein